MNIPKKQVDRSLFIAVECAVTPLGDLLSGQIAEADAEIRKTYPQFFRPLEIKYPKQ